MFFLIFHLFLLILHSMANMCSQKQSAIKYKYCSIICIQSWFIISQRLNIKSKKKNMGNTTTQDKMEQQFSILHTREDGSALMKHRKTEQQYLLRCHCSTIEDEISMYLGLLERRRSLKSMHLLDVMRVERKTEKHVCSTISKVYVLVEYPFKTLYDEIVERKPVNNYFNEDQLWSVLYSCCCGLRKVYEAKFNHQCLSSRQIYITKEGIIKISDPVVLGLEKNYTNLLKNKQNRDYLIVSPELMNFLDDCNFSFYDKEMSDVFILGCIMLEASILEDTKLYDSTLKKPTLDKLQPMLNKLYKKYSSKYADMIASMVSIHSKLRPKFSEIEHRIEKENVNQTQQTSANPKKSHSIHSSESQTNLKNHPKGEVLRTRTLSEHTLTYPSHQIYQIPYPKPLGEAMPNQKQETIIKKLKVSEPNSAQLPTTYTHPQIPSYISSFSPGNIKVQSNYITGSVQPLSFEDRFSSQVFANVSIQSSVNNAKGIIYSQDIPQIKHILQSHKKETSYPRSEEEETFRKVPKIVDQPKNHIVPLPNKSPPSYSPPSNLLNPIPQIPSFSPASPRSSFPSRAFNKKVILEDNCSEGKVLPLSSKAIQFEQKQHVCELLEGGGKYEGYKQFGMKNGYGKLYFRDGGFYQGEWKQNKMNGYGRLHYENGQIAYEGNWENDEFHGEGRIFNDRPEKLNEPFDCQDFQYLGDKWIFYQGQFQNDSKHGKGKIKLTNGEVFEGMFVEDTIEGQGIFYNIQGEIIQGQWKDNRLVS